MLTVDPSPSHIGYDASQPNAQYISRSHLNYILTHLFSTYRAHLLQMATTLTSHHTLPPSSSHVHDLTLTMDTWSIHDDDLTHTIATPLSSTSSPSMTSRTFQSKSVSSTLSREQSPLHTSYPPMTIPSHTHTHACSDCQHEDTFDLSHPFTSTSSHTTSHAFSTCSHTTSTQSSPAMKSRSSLSSSKSLDTISSHRSSLSEIFNDTREYGIVLADSNQSITHVNHGFTSITGYTCWESVGRKCNFLQGAHTNHDAVRMMRDSLSHNQTCRVGILNYKKNGEPFWNMLTITPLFDAHGSIHHYVGIQVVQSHSTHVPRPMPLFPWNQTPDAPGASYKQQKLIRAGAKIDEEGQIIPPLPSTSTSILQPKLKSRPISFVAETNLPTDKGMFRVRAYKDLSKGNSVDSEIMCIIHGNIENRSDIVIRVHDQCYTSEILGSLKCDCRLQLDYAMQYIQEYEGMVIYMPQEGRGIGLANKIKAYSVQELGYDTVDANRVLGFEDDLREYNVIPSILSELNISSVRLITNNPRKIEQLTDLGVNVTGRVPIIMESNIHSQNYILAKRARMGHKSQ